VEEKLEAEEKLESHGEREDGRILAHLSMNAAMETNQLDPGCRGNAAPANETMMTAVRMTLKSLTRGY
jgi:hypothetical protein